MAISDFSRVSSRSVTTGDRFHGYFANIVGSVVSWNDARKTRAELMKLSAHELDDLGISRGDIDAIVGKALR